MGGREPAKTEGGGGGGGWGEGVVGGGGGGVWQELRGSVSHVLDLNRS